MMVCMKVWRIAALGLGSSQELRKAPLCGYQRCVNQDLFTEKGNDIFNRALHGVGGTGKGDNTRYQGIKNGVSIR